MSLPFTAPQFFEVFRNYNLSIWPMQIVAYLIGLIVVGSLFTRIKGASRLVWGALSFFWLWMGIAYHILHFSLINKAAYGFGILFVLEGLLFLGMGAMQSGIRLQPGRNLASLVGGVLILYALLFYPLLGAWLGHGYPFSPGFGVAPCPTTIFTFGMLLFAERRVPLTLLVIPFLWSLLGFSAAISMGVREDVGLLIAGLATVTIALWQHRSPVQATRRVRV